MMDVAFFIEMAWKSSAISAAALALAALLRARALADRAPMLRAALGLLLALPAIALLLPALQVELAALAQPVPSAAPIAAVASELSVAAAPVPSIWDDPSILVWILYLGGAAMIAARLIAGIATLSRWTAAAQPVTDVEWLDALERASADAGGVRVRLLVSEHAPSPLSWGWLRPVVLIDADTMRASHEADAVLAHELSHAARGDWATLLLARAAVALFWFNPLVWLVERCAMDEAEEAADRHALARVEPAKYAQTLLNFASVSQPHPAIAVSIASGQMSRRVAAILDGRVAAARRGSRLVLLGTAAALAIAAPVAALKFVAPVQADPPHVSVAAAAPIAPSEPASVIELAEPARQQAPDAPTPPLPPLAPASPDAPAAPSVFTMALAPSPPAPPEPPAPPAPPSREGTWVHIPDTSAIVADAMRAADAARIDGQRARIAALRAASRERAHAIAEARAVADTASLERIIAARVERSLRTAEVQRRRGMASGAIGMEKGADAMDRGAARMDTEAAHLRDPGHRARRIAEAAAQGRTETHESLLESIPELREGAREMREGAREMRHSAREMRNGG